MRRSFLESLLVACPLIVVFAMASASRENYYRGLFFSAAEQPSTMSSIKTVVQSVADASATRLRSYRKFAGANLAPVPLTRALRKCDDDTVPSGATSSGYTKRVINECPNIDDISPDGSGIYTLYSGQWYAKKPPSLEHYSMQDGVLSISLNGDLVSIPRNFTKGKLPLLPGNEGFFVEFDVRLSDNDPDHWPAVWLMPAEHNNIQSDHYEGDPNGFERWLELDVDEGGFGPGFTGTAINWVGIWPNYKRILNPNNISPDPLDRSKIRTFAASYNPTLQKVTWWLDDEMQMSAGIPYVPAIAAKQHFYLIISAQTHGKAKPYVMLLSRFRAFVPPSAPLPEV